MKEQINATVYLLEKALQTQIELTSQLFACAAKAEMALIQNDMDGLRAAVDMQEDISMQFMEEERIRRQQVKLLSVLLHMGEADISLKEITQRLPDRERAEKLEQIGSNLANLVAEVQEKNSTVREMLTLKSEYVNTMLGLLSGRQDVRGQGYNARGDLTKAYDHCGMYEVLI